MKGETFPLKQQKESYIYICIYIYTYIYIYINEFVINHGKSIEKSDDKDVVLKCFK